MFERKCSNFSYFFDKISAASDINRRSQMFESYVFVRLWV